MTDTPKTYSIALRLRRITYEDAYVTVPVTEAILKRNEDGTGAIDFEAFTAAAIRSGGDDRVEWKHEETKLEPHPVQGPLPEGRTSFEMPEE